MPDPLTTVDLAVVGGGPAGRAVALRARTRGLSSAVIDPTPERPWPASYGAWTDELPGWLPDTVVAAGMPDASAIARSAHRLGREYVMLSTPRLQSLLSSDPSVQEVAGSVLAVTPGGGATPHHILLEGGQRVAARVVIDASGPRRVVTGGAPQGVRAAQTAVGVIVPADGLSPCFMDWRDDHGERGWPTFLYAVPLGEGRMLLEETSLARRPGLELAVLRRRLDRRLAARGIEVPDAAAVERVDFVVDLPLSRGSGVVVPFGAAAPLLHPATGYSLAAALRLADPLVDAVASGLPDGRGAAALAREVVWSPQARLVHRLRLRGLEVVLALPPEGVVDFFELFFALPSDHQRAYLSEREDARAVMAAMLAVFRDADGPLRRHLVRIGATPGRTRRRALQDRVGVEGSAT